MLPASHTTLSPIGTDEFPCTGAHLMYRQTSSKPHPYCYALRVGIKKTDNCTEMLVKIPLSDTQKRLAQELLQAFKCTYPVSVTFQNIQIRRYEINQKIIYSATADTFQITEV